MPRSKYAKVTGLDKLHRKQKAALRQERQKSVTRATSMEQSTFVFPSSTTTSQPADLSATNSIPLDRISTTSSPSLLNVTSIPQTISSLPYSLARTNSGNLAIYEDSKRGGNKHITQIRKISGDLDTLQADLRTALSLPDSFTDQKGRKKENVAINRVTRQIVVRGWRGPEIKKWAELVGF